jgi:hypothetical protein
MGLSRHTHPDKVEADLSDLLPPLGQGPPVADLARPENRLALTRLRALVMTRSAKSAWTERAGRAPLARALRCWRGRWRW